VVAAPAVIIQAIRNLLKATHMGRCALLDWPAWLDSHDSAMHLRVRCTCLDNSSC
jgi:hypothetical protein